MSPQISIRTNLLSPLSSSQTELRTDRVITLADGCIKSIEPFSKKNNIDFDLSNCLTIPGLIDLHVHLSQFRIKGHYREALLPWLNDIVFPEEAKSIDYGFAYELAERFIQELYNAGTTTAVIYTAPFRSSCEAAFDAAGLNNLRAFIGMTLMDRNSPAGLLQDTQKTMADCLSLIEQYHSPANGMQYIFTPRFAPTCSMQLMQWIGEYCSKNGIWIQTHLSENRDEIKWVKELFEYDTYTDVYAAAGILTNKTILAHCIHLDDSELRLIKSSHSKIAHCPDSNFYLRSGQFPLSEIRLHDIPFALGSDVGAGTTLNMLYHAKMYNFRQTETPVSPSDAFYRVTLGAAELLGLQDSIGSLETGKSADLVILRLPEPNYPLTDDILPELVFTGHDWKIEQVYARGIRKA
jgi:guanine deaminase